MSFFYKKLPSKENYRVYQLRKKLVFLFLFISLIAIIISGLSFNENPYFIIVPILIAILYQIGISPTMKVFFRKKKMRKEGGGMFDFKKPTIFYIEK